MLTWRWKVMVYMSTTFMGLLSRMLRGSEARRRRIFHAAKFIHAHDS